MGEKTERLQSDRDELFKLIESNRASVSRVTFDVEENATKLTTHLSNVELRLNAEMGLSRYYTHTYTHTHTHAHINTHTHIHTHPYNISTPLYSE
jgi:hypothetical protein